MAQKFQPVVLKHSDGTVVQADSPAEQVNYEARGYRVEAAPAKPKTSEDRSSK